MLTGHSPFARGDIGSTMNALLNEPPDFGTLRPSDAIVRVLEHGLAKHPEARYQSITEFGDALADAAIGR